MSTPSPGAIAPTIQTGQSKISQEEFRWLASNFVQIKAIAVDLQTRVAALEAEVAALKTG